MLNLFGGHFTSTLFTITLGVRIEGMKGDKDKTPPQGCSRQGKNVRAGTHHGGSAVSEEHWILRSSCSYHSADRHGGLGIGCAVLIFSYTGEALSLGRSNGDWAVRHFAALTIMEMFEIIGRGRKKRGKRIRAGATGSRA